ncbi:hypothetical protein A6V36_32340 [Paraburkholderia ginsengiterrae]|uniref:(S)-ureidoglycine aminohydrolase cupin domain-containing protein n=1 Tax=Paraburkholderia ginsengiterrae TaxID=1462993 RepID=A0A1A9N8H2_9BURK|nr:cupin domain-containing protein [Paraburkholderia ginsengiterrae]OAJ57123.1 hypothetical protein A6V36_32340 [Paraburkholderia ginsengiterrae]OAJ61349.1 hypothetical protein A6V37_25380 [Paraburkholderia ginsengiterrae]
MSFTAIKHGVALSELDAWGSLTGLGGEILDGSDVQAFGKFTHGAPTDAISAGYFGTSKGKFRLVYPFSEQATLLAGEIRITDESTGETRHFRPGDTWFVTKGTPTVWEVIGDEFTKHYLSFA